MANTNLPQFHKHTQYIQYSIRSMVELCTWGVLGRPNLVFQVPHQGKQGWCYGQAPGDRRLMPGHLSATFPGLFCTVVFPQQVTNIHMQSCVFSCAQAEHEKNQYRKISTRNQLPAFNHARQYPMTAVKLMMPGGATSGLHPGSSSLG